WMAADDGIACAEGVGAADIRRLTVPVEVFSWQLGVFEPAAIEPPGLETKTKQELLQLAKPKQKISVLKKHAGDVLFAFRNKLQDCMGGPRFRDYGRGKRGRQAN